MNPRKIDRTIQLLQLVTLTLGIAGVFLVIGKRDQVIQQTQTAVGDLAEVSRDLLEASFESKYTDRNHDRQLEDLRQRIERLTP